MATISRRKWIELTSVLGGSCVWACRPDVSDPASSPTSRTSTPSPPPAASSAEIEKGVEEEASPPEPEAQTPSTRIYLQQLGAALPPDDIVFVLEALSVFFPHPAVQLPPIPLPPESYYPPRSRYRAEKILAHLRGITPKDAQVVMGLTAVDISTTKGQYEDWGILGLATIGGQQCVISRFRAKRDARDALHTRIRLAKTVIHEVGHTLGLDHCPHYGCLMEDGQGTVKTTDHEYDFCDRCRGLVAEAVLPRDKSRIPWPKPS